MRVATLRAEHVRTFDVVNTINTLVAIFAYPTCTCKCRYGPLQCIFNKTSVDKLVSRSLAMVARLYNPDIPTFGPNHLLSLLTIRPDNSDQLGFLLRQYHNSRGSLLLIQYSLTQPTTNPYFHLTMPPAGPEGQFRFLISCIRYSNNGKVTIRTSYLPCCQLRSVGRLYRSCKRMQYCEQRGSVRLYHIFWLPLDAN